MYIIHSFTKYDRLFYVLRRWRKINESLDNLLSILNTSIFPIYYSLLRSKATKWKKSTEKVFFIHLKYLKLFSIPKRINFVALREAPITTEKYIRFCVQFERPKSPTENTFLIFQSCFTVRIQQRFFVWKNRK